jgi:hypothetical protein
MPNLAGVHLSPSLAAAVSPWWATSSLSPSLFGSSWSSRPCQAAASWVQKPCGVLVLVGWPPLAHHQPHSRTERWCHALRMFVSRSGHVPVDRPRYSWADGPGRPALLLQAVASLVEPSKLASPLRAGPRSCFRPVGQRVYFKPFSISRII